MENGERPRRAGWIVAGGAAVAALVAGWLWLGPRDGPVAPPDPVPAVQTSDPDGAGETGRTPESAATAADPQPETAAAGGPDPGEPAAPGNLGREPAPQKDASDAPAEPEAVAADRAEGGAGVPGEEAGTDPVAPAGSETVAPPQAGGATDAAAPETAEAAVDPVAPESGQAAPPAFDVVRIDPEGNALVAGTAPAGATVSVEVDGEVLGSATADAGGGFAAIFAIPPAARPRIVELVTEGAEGAAGQRSTEQVIIAPPQVAPTSPAAQGTDPDGGTPAATAPAPGTGASAMAPAAEMAPAGEARAVVPGGSVTATPTAPETASTAPAVTGGPEAVPDVAPAGPVAPTVLLSRREGVELLQPGGVGRTPPGERVTIDLISYGDGGEVMLGGRLRAAAGGELRLYLDNEQVHRAALGAGGTWEAGLPRLRPGVYTLRADQVDASGQVISRFETPFKREDPALLAQMVPGTAAGALSASVITVQPGYSLWRIATDRYGEGMRYVQIFEANRTQIRDPDLIYPGQVFDLPEEPDVPAQ